MLNSMCVICIFMYNVYIYIYIVICGNLYVCTHLYIYNIHIYIYNIMILSHIGTVYDSIYMYTNKERAVYIYIYIRYIFAGRIRLAM